MRYGVYLSWLGVCLLPGFALGQVVVEAPQANQAMAGIRPYFGYACETAGQSPSTITVAFNGGTPSRIASGLDRADTKTVCNNDGFNGFMGFTNFNLLPGGQNTFELYRDGVAVATVPFLNVPWSNGTEFIPGPDPTSPAPANGTFDPTAPATSAFFLFSGFPHFGRAALMHYDASLQGLGIISTRSQTDPGLTKNDLVLLLGNGGIRITVETDPPETVLFPGKNAITSTPLGPLVTNSDGQTLGALAAVFGDENFAASSSAQSPLVSGPIQEIARSGQEMGYLRLLLGGSVFTTPHHSLVIPSERIKRPLIGQTQEGTGLVSEVPLWADQADKVWKLRPVLLSISAILGGA